MNDLDLCLEDVGHINHCVTFAVEYLGGKDAHRYPDIQKNPDNKLSVKMAAYSFHVLFV